MAKELTREEIQNGTQNGTKKYENLDFLGKYAMYMGVAQLLEFGLKKLHQENMEIRWKEWRDGHWEELKTNLLQKG